MSLTLNMVGGGGGLKATDALLRVQAPAGSTVTITKSGMTKTDLGHENALDPTVYDYYFIIHQSQFDSVNPWTVTATLGTQSISDEILINAADEYDLELLYTLYLIKNGEIQTEDLIAVGMKNQSSSSGTAVAPNVTYNTSNVQIGWTANADAAQSGIAYFPLKYNLAKYSKIHISGSVRNNTSYASNAQMKAWTELGTYQSDNRILAQTLSETIGTSYASFSDDIDISTLVDEAFIGISAFRNASSYVSVRITELYLEV